MAGSEWQQVKGLQWKVVIIYQATFHPREFTSQFDETKYWETCARWTGSFHDNYHNVRWRELQWWVLAVLKRLQDQVMGRVYFNLHGLILETTKCGSWEGTPQACGASFLFCHGQAKSGYQRGGRLRGKAAKWICGHLGLAVGRVPWPRSWVGAPDMEVSGNSAVTHSLPVLEETPPPERLCKATFLFANQQVHNVTNLHCRCILLQADHVQLLSLSEVRWIALTRSGP